MEDGSTSFPIEKFSHSSSAPTSSSHQWNHESKRDGLFLVFRKLRLQGTSFEPVQERFVMSIISGGDVLERQDLGDLVDITRSFESMSQTMALNTSRIDAPVQIVVKRPCIAMRYTKDPTKVQRIQVRFKHDLDYESSLSILRDLGLPVKDAAQTAPQAPSITSKPTMQAQSEIPKELVVGSSTATANLYTAQMKESDVHHKNAEHSAVSSYVGGDRPHSTSTETLRSSSAASQHWLPPGRSDLTYSSTAPILSKPVVDLARSDNKSALYVNQPLSDMSGGVYRGQNYLSSTFSVPSQRTSNASTSDSLVPTASTSIGPSEMYAQHQTPHAWSSKTDNTQAQSEMVPPSYISQLRANPAGGSRSSSANSPYGLDSAQAESKQDSSKLGRSVSIIGRSPSAEFFNPSLMRKSSLPSNSFPDQILPRPQSVPIIHPSPYDDYLLPPKRELTFLKDRENAKLRNQSTTKVASSAKSGNVASTNGSVSLPSPTSVELKKPARRVAERKKKLSTTQNGNDSAPLDSREEAAAPSLVEGDDSPLAKPPAALSEPHHIALHELSKPAAAASKRPSSAMEKPEFKRHKMVNQSTQTQTLSGRNHTVPLITLPVNTVGVPPELAPTPPPASVLDQIDNFVRTNSSRPAPIKICESPEYSEASEAGRRVMVNDWICDNLENEDFLKLCEDVGHSWRRIGLGF